MSSEKSPWFTFAPSSNSVNLANALTQVSSQKEQIKSLETDADEIYKNWETTPESYVDDPVAYQDWFSHCSSLKDASSMGFVDLFSRIITLDIYRIMGNPHDKTALEIGFGGGRVLNAAAHVFKEAIGIDILSPRCFQATKQFLADQHTENIKLIHYDDVASIVDKSVDFVYSFIVFQHFGSVDFYHAYVKLIKRVLADSGCATLWLGKNTLNNDDFLVHNTLADCKSNCTAYYKPDFVARTLQAAGFRIVALNTQNPKNPWTLDKQSSQFAVTFVHA